MIELKDISEYTGIKFEDLKTVDEFKAAFDKDFIKQSAITEESEPVKKILGKVFGTLENDIKKVAKGFELDIDFESDDFKANKKVNDKFKFVLGKYDEKNKATIADLTAKAGLGNDDKVRELQTKWEKATQKAKETETLLNSTKTEFEQYKTNTVNEIKTKTLSSIKKEIYAKAKFLPDANEFTKKGFLTSFEEKYNFDLDENENPFITTKKGEKIISSKVAGAFKTPAEVLEEELISAKLYVLNPAGGQKKPEPQKQEQPGQVIKRTRTVATPL
ncbi:MAG: hypothetical protein V4608_10950 [Bacteroidota bacterium]